MPIPSAQKWLRVQREADKALVSAKTKRAAALREFVGRHHAIAGEDAARSDDQPVSLVNRSITVMLGHLAGRAPAEIVTPRRPGMDLLAMMLQMKLDDLNRDLDRMTLSRMMILSGLLGPAGILKVGLREAEDMYLIEGEQYNAGEPYIQYIDFDDYTCDPAARNQWEMGWEGYQYKVKRRALLESGLFEADKVMRLTPIGDAGGVGSTQGFMSSPDEHNMKLGRDHFVEDVIQLMDVIFFHDHGAEIATISPTASNRDLGWLFSRQHTGPGQSPLHKFQPYPIWASTQGSPFINGVLDVNSVAKVVMSKMVEDVKAARRLTLFNRQAVTEDEADTVEAARSGSMVGVDDINNYTDTQMGGVLPDVMPVMSFVDQWFNMASSSADILGGTGGGGARTATEYSGLQQNAQTVLADVARHHHAVQEGISRDLAFYIMSDPLRRDVLTARTPENTAIPLVYDAATREGDHVDFNFNIRQGSMELREPAVRLRRLMEWVNIASGMVDPTTGLPVVNPQEAAKILGEEMGIESLERMIMNSPGMAMRQQSLQSVPQPGQAMGQPGQARTPPRQPYGQQQQAPQATPGQNQQTTAIDAVRSSLTTTAA